MDKRTEVAEMIADWFSRSVMDSDYGLATQIIDRLQPEAKRQQVAARAEAPEWWMGPEVIRDADDVAYDREPTYGWRPDERA
jgi:hypothetical protein